MIAGASSNRIDSCFTGSNSGYAVDGTDEDFAIPNLVRLGTPYDGIYGVLYSIVFEYNLKLYFGEKINSIFASTINLGVALLSAKSFHLGHGHSLNADIGKRFLDVLKFEWLDDCVDFFHGLLCLQIVVAGTAV